jgi:pilus assembly protein Flp/PilA
LKPSCPDAKIPLTHPGAAPAASARQRAVRNPLAFLSHGEFQLITQQLRRLLHDESGQDLIEYALIAALVAIIAITGLNGLSSKINSEFTKIGNDL